ncbi:hypothetical protein PR202_ga07896 [Eleusine coracana subsp. coracana]|uniref:Uncharacterized protein n=1 Tax=Eleusine coracana subsp. coracana TaxID=191504 RepID=A0AAV5C0E6_ELECO|nr:hypothetical protein PR202_ga07896 [Eleusine coracana subsp. coracana]
MSKVRDPPRRSTSWLSAIVCRKKHRPDAASLRSAPTAAQQQQPDEEPESPGGMSISSTGTSTGTSWWFPSPSPARQQHHHRRRHGAGASGDGGGMSGFAVCLSPLVRPGSAGGGRRRCQPPDSCNLGETHRRHASAGGASSFGRNTSRKLADMSRFR